MALTFVYGTLLRGEGNHGFIENQRFVGEAKTKPEFRFISLGPFPALLPDGETAVKGELYDLDAEALGDVDRLEGHPDFYTRQTIELEDGRKAWGYVLVNNHRIFLPAEDDIASGSWKEYGRR